MQLEGIVDLYRIRNTFRDLRGIFPPHGWTNCSDRPSHLAVELRDGRGDPVFEERVDAKILTSARAKLSRKPIPNFCTLALQNWRNIIEISIEKNSVIELYLAVPLEILATVEKISVKLVQ